MEAGAPQAGTVPASGERAGAGLSAAWQTGQEAVGVKQPGPGLTYCQEAGWPRAGSSCATALPASEAWPAVPDALSVA